MGDVPGWIWLTLSGLLLLSGVCSASEAALFSLTRGEQERCGSRVRRLLERPLDLLITLLLTNLVVNILFFAFADRLWLSSEGATEESGFAAELLALFGALFAVLIGGEILPKTLGLRGRVGFARFTAPMWLLLMGLLSPVRRLLVGLLEFFGRIAERGGDERRLTPVELAAALEGAVSPGGLYAAEADLLSEIIELRSIRVRELMTPRVDIEFLELDGSNLESCLAVALDRRRTWLPVIGEGVDDVRGIVTVRELLLHPDRPVAQRVMPVLFVPEVAGAIALLRLFRESRAAEAVCVDEWGGTAGLVTLEDVFEELLGDLRVEGEARQADVVPIGSGAYRVPGQLSVREWNEAFGRKVVPTEFETVGGMVTALLGRIPRHGDEVRFENLVVNVVEVRGRRVIAVEVHIEQPAESAP